jgi:hypothetical protein
VIATRRWCLSGALLRRFDEALYGGIQAVGFAAIGGATAISPYRLSEEEGVSHVTL